MALRTLRTFSTLIEAQVACSYLESNGIQAVVPDRDMIARSSSGLTWGVNMGLNFIPGVKLEVDEVDVEKANSLLLKKEKQFKNRKG